MRGVRTRGRLGRSAGASARRSRAGRQGPVRSSDPMVGRSSAVRRWRPVGGPCSTASQTPRGVPSLKHEDRVRGRGRCRRFAAPGRCMACPGDGRRGGQPRFQPRVPSRAQPAARRLLGGGTRWSDEVLRVLRRRDLIGANAQRQRPARGDGPSRGSPASIRRWQTSASPATTAFISCCTTTSRGRPPPRCRDTTGPRMTSRTDCGSRSGRGTES